MKKRKRMTKSKPRVNFLIPCCNCNGTGKIWSVTITDSGSWRICPLCKGTAGMAVKEILNDTDGIESRGRSSYLKGSELTKCNA